MRGRKPKPTQLRIIRGNPGKRPLPEHEAQAEPKLPPPLPHLSAAAKKEWRRTGKRLLALGLVTEIDSAALGIYCQAYGRWSEAEEQLTKFGTVIKAPSGFLVQSPYLAIANKCMEQMMKALVEFGMSPSSRSRVHAAKDTGRDNPLKNLLARKVT